MKIMIVDDQHESRYLLKTLLEGNGHEVTPVRNGAEALEKLDTEIFELIVSDILMPVMDGFELCRKIKQDEKLRDIPFIFYTGTYTGLKDEEFAMKIGADRFIVKPCEPDAFIEAVQNVMARKERGDAGREPVRVAESEVLKLYNERLVRKLEHKMEELEKEVQTRREVEVALRSSEALLRISGKLAHLGGWSVDLEKNLVVWSDEVAAIHGMPPGFSPTVEEGMSFYAPEFYEKIKEVFNNCASKGIPYDEEMQIISKDDRRVWVRTIGVAERDESGSIVKVSGGFQDITDRKAAEEAHQKLQSQFFQAQKMESVGLLAGGIAHDFNNLLSVILGYGEMLLKETGENHPHRELLDEICQAAMRAKGLTLQLLAFSRRQVLNTNVVDLNDVVSGFLTLLRRLIGEDIEVNISLNPQALKVKADASQIEQVLMNLAVNARDVMPQGGMLTIETSVAELDESFAETGGGLPAGEYAMICVSDSGSGMSREILTMIFEPFFTTKERDKGTGLGLATSYGIVKQHGGEIRVYSEPGQGTVFKIYLPLTPEELKHAERQLEKPKQFKGPARVLVVEDDVVFRNIIVRVLTGGGFIVIDSKNAMDAVEKASAHTEPIDLVLTDVIMPELKGPQVFERVREYHPEANVLYISGYPGNIISRQGILPRGVNFIGKPFTIEDLLKKVSDILIS